MMSYPVNLLFFVVGGSKTHSFKEGMRENNFLLSFSLAWEPLSLQPVVRCHDSYGFTVRPCSL